MSVETLISQAQGYAATTVTAADAALQAGINAVQQVGHTVFSYDGVPLPAPPVVPDALEAPTLEDINLELPAEPDDELLFQDISPIELGTQPVLTAIAPTLDLPNKPSQNPEFSATLPAINTNLTFPEPPSILMNPLVDAPIITDRDEPVKPQTLLPSFTALAPTDLPVAPTDLQGSFQDAYNSAAPGTITMLDGYVDAMLAKFNPRYHEQMGRIETQLATYLNGGTGMDPDEENAIYERSRGKHSAEALRVSDTAWTETADRGFTLPGGAILSAVQAARQGAADLNAAAAREIVVLKMEQEQKNLQFAVTTSASLRTTLLNSALSYHQNLITINGQALDYAKNILAAIIEVYNTSVKAFTVRLDLYRAEAAVFETRLKSALAGIELYKVEIQALEALANVDRAKVEVYKARIDALMVYAKVYEAQIEAVQGRASLEKMKIEVFQAQVQGFTATVQGKNAEWLGYKASIEGEQAVANMYGEQVKVFGIQTDAWRTGILGRAEVAKAQALTNGARAENFKAIMSGYNTVVEARGSVARTRLENQRQRVIGFQAASQAQVANAQIRNEYYRTTGDIAIKNASLSIEAIVKSAQGLRDYSSTLASLYNANAQVHGQYAGSVMAGMNTLAAQTLTE